MRQTLGLRLILASTIILLEPVATTRAGIQHRATDAMVHLLGAGSTFDAPFFDRAFAAYTTSHPIAVTYQSVGSGAGITRFSQNLVDFGATDVPMNGPELALAVREGGAVEQVPVTLGGIAIAYNLPGLAQPLRLDGPTLAKLFLGTISRWRDSRIIAANPGAAIPDLPIMPIHRSDSSGTTYIATDYLSTISPGWLSRVGRGKKLTWPTTSAGNGNPGVAAAIQAHVGAIGYVELSYALARRLPYAAILNEAGAYVLPSPETISAAAAQFPIVDADQFSIVDAIGQNSYPIAGYSWALLRRHLRIKKNELVALFQWLVTSGQQYAARVHYVPLPPTVQRLALQLLGHID